MGNAYEIGFLTKCAELGVPADLSSAMLKRAQQGIDFDSIDSFMNDIVQNTKKEFAGTPGVDYDDSRYVNNFRDEYSKTHRIDFGDPRKQGIPANMNGANQTGYLLTDPKTGKTKWVSSPSGPERIFINNTRDPRQQEQTLIHEMTHAQNNDMNGHTGVSEFERNLADEAYGFKDNDRIKKTYGPRANEVYNKEEFTTNRQYRYYIYKSLAKQLGRKPTYEEFNNYVVSMSPEDLYGILVRNGHGVNSYVDPKYWSNPDGSMNADRVEKTRDAIHMLASKVPRRV